jgi:hypothetical protein
MSKQLVIIIGGAGVAESVDPVTKLPVYAGRFQGAVVTPYNDEEYDRLVAIGAAAPFDAPKSRKGKRKASEAPAADGAPSEPDGSEPDEDGSDDGEADGDLVDIFGPDADPTV